LHAGVMGKKLIIDADTGVDDAMAIVAALHAHKTGRARVLAITTVAGNASSENVLRFQEQVS